ncbi:hypothetical protein AKJ54_00660 [candidate division MSBL1 archaeon SCGC-AAA382K21]|uniref:Uncharacterized protein n=1 Tax=candidate division MSBL1 archaeon SCGC-AAA382K21 TaxID=1698283 RepID=A0A133VL42_9EURY|nr:hypothetical protein AKJ54_00660 [candidate division MSBL1 archaeon SCGC-AAA382K21]
MELRTMKKRQRRMFDGKSEEEKAREIRAKLEAIRARIKHSEKTVKNLGKAIEKDQKEAKMLQDMLQNKKFEEFKNEYYRIL